MMRTTLDDRNGVARGTNAPAWVVLALVCLGQFMVVLDISIVNVALPSIQSELGFSASGLQWILNAYTLTFAGFLLLGGRAGDLFGRRRMFLAGLGMFTVASFVGGLAQSQGTLIAARALQGLGAAVLAPATLTILTTTFTEATARARALGVGIALLGVFVWLQTKHARAPLMPLRIFRSRALDGANLYLMLLFGAMFGTWYFETLFMQHVLGYTPLAAGLAFLPQTILIAVGSQVAARLVTRFGPRRLLVAGTVFAVAGVAWLTRITPASTFAADLLGPFLLIGLGMGLSVTPATVAATSGVAPEDAGLASGLLNTSRFIGASVGLAVLATVAAARTSAAAGSAATALTQGYARALDVAVVLLAVAGAVAALVVPGTRRTPALIPAPEAPTDDDAAPVVVMFDGEAAPELESA
jgi:MFS family permease